MVIPGFGNALPKLEHNTTQIVGPEVRKDNYKRKILSWIGYFLSILVQGFAECLNTRKPWFPGAHYQII